MREKSIYMTRAQMVEIFDLNFAEQKKDKSLRDYGELNQAWNDMFDLYKRDRSIDPSFDKGWKQPEWVARSPKKTIVKSRKDNVIRVVKEGKTLLTVKDEQAKAIFDSLPYGVHIDTHIKKELRKIGWGKKK